MKRLLLFIPVISITLLLFLTGTSASNARLVITEIMPDPEGEDSKLEWIEIKNISSDNIRLEEWQINNAKLPENTIEPGDYAILARNPDSFKSIFEESMEADVPIIPASFSLPNSGGTVHLSNSSINSTSSFEYPEAEQGRSIELLDGDCSKISINSGKPTPGSANNSCTLSVSVTPANNCMPLFISKALPNPSDGSEWVMISNPNSEKTDLSGFSIRTSSNRIENLMSYSILVNSETKIELKNINLKNSGDRIQLLCSGQVIDTFDYPEAGKGIVYEIRGVEMPAVHEPDSVKEIKTNESKETKTLIYKIPVFFRIDY